MEEREERLCFSLCPLFVQLFCESIHSSQRRQLLMEVERGNEVGRVRVRGKGTMTWHIVVDMYDYVAWDMRVLTILTVKINRRVVLIPFVNFEGKYDLKKPSGANLILSENFRGKYDLLPNL